MNNLKKSKLIRFKKEEIHQIMEVYSKKISIGEWKDYSISFQNSHAVFAIHRSFKLGPCLEIKKNYKLKIKTMVKRGDRVETILKVLKN